MSETCSVCGVVIEEDTVKFAVGKPGDRSKLHARVCQYTEESDCINRQAKDNVLKDTDYYAEFK